MERLKRIISLLLVTVILCTFAPGVFAVEPTAIYVSPDGNDEATGTINDPLKTIEGAKKRVQELGGNVSEVIFREGTYRFHKAINFTAADSGTEEKPIVYRAYDGEEVNFKQSVELDMSKAEPITDEATLKRLRDGVSGKLIQIDLTAQGIKQSDILDTSYIKANQSYLVNSCYANEIFVDDKVQPVAQWPNGDENYTRWAEELGMQGFRYAESEPSRWVNAKNWWVCAKTYFDFFYFFHGVQSVDVKNKIINVVPNADYPFHNPYSMHWKAFNLLEELDVPGEFHIDRDTMTLYMYPPYSLVDSTVELSIGNSHMFEGENLSNVTFKGIHFSQSQGYGFRLSKVVNVDFIDCKFSHIGGMGIYIYSSEGYRSDAFMKDGVHRHASYDVDVKGNIFYNIGYHAMHISSGDADTLTPGNLVIENNYLCRVNRFTHACYGPIRANGCGVVVRQNTITHSRQHGIRPMGNEILMEKNELYDICRDVGDGGAIYTGGSQVQRGYVIRQNYIHDVGNVNTNNGRTAGAVGIYLDEQAQGHYVYQNILVNCHIGYNSNGSGAIEFHDNTIVDAGTHWNFHDFVGHDNEIADWTHQGTVDDAINRIYDKEAYFKAYPLLKEWAETKKNSKIWNNIHDNLIVGNSEGKVGKQDAKFATFTNNPQIPETDAFVDPANNDYRLKSDSDLAQQLPNVLNESFDLDEIGVQMDLVFNEETAPFRLLHPQNGDRVASSKVYFSWEDTLGSNSYRLTIAKDADFKDIVYNEVVKKNSLELELEKGNRYYWKVNTINTSRPFANEWSHDGAPYTFTIDVYEKLNTSTFDEEVVKAEERIATEREDGTAGAFKAGTALLLQKYIDVTRLLLNLRLGKYSQKSLDARTEFIAGYYSGYAKREEGFVDVLALKERNNWKGITLEGDVIINESSNGEHVGGSNVFANMAGSVLYCFDIIAENDGSYMCVGMNKSNTTAQWKAGNNGYVTVTKADRLELQKVDNSKNTIVDERMGVTLNDGKRHSVIFGYLNTTVGCNVILAVDGELIFNYGDVDSTSNRNQPMEFVTTATPTGSKIQILQSENIPTAEDFQRLKSYCEANAAVAVSQSFPNAVGEKILKEGYNKIITEKGIYDVSYATPELSGETLMVPASAIAKIFEGTATANSSSAILKIRGNEFVFNNGSGTYTVNGEAKSVSKAPYVKNGYLMVSLEDIVSNVGSSMVTDWICNVTVITDDGIPNAANEGENFQNSLIVLEKFSNLGITNDIIIQALKTPETPDAPDAPEEVLLDAPIESELNIAFLGDSLTRSYAYINYLDAFIKTRFPDKRIRLINAGKDGEYVTGGMARFDEDVVAKDADKLVICFGANDVERYYYKNGSAASKASAIAQAKENLESAILTAQKSGIKDIILMSAPTQDDRANYVPGSGTEALIGLSDGLNQIAENTKALAKKYKLEYIDLNTFTDDIMDRAEKAGTNKEEIISADRIHPNTLGYFMIATKIAETLYADSNIVGAVDINAATGENSVVNATVSDVSTANGGVSFTYQAKSLPMGVDSNYNKAVENYSKPATGADNGEYFEFTEKMNQEIIKVTNLKAGNYTISFGDVVLGTYTAKELAAGVNIAVNEKNPGQAQALEIVKSYAAAISEFGALRYFENLITILKQNNAYEGRTKDEMATWLDNNNYSGSYFSSLYDTSEESYKKLWTLEANAYKKAQPQSYNVTITPVK